MINLGKLKEIKDLRKVWPHEALDFTPWLAEEDNLALLADAVGLEITIDETESSVEISMLIFLNLTCILPPIINLFFSTTALSTEQQILWSISAKKKLSPRRKHMKNSVS